MNLNRSELVDLLLARGSTKAAGKAEECLPEQIDIERDKAKLTQCGIDPKALAVILGVDDELGIHRGAPG